MKSYNTKLTTTKKVSSPKKITARTSPEPSVPPLPLTVKGSGGRPDGVCEANVVGSGDVQKKEPQPRKKLNKTITCNQCKEEMQDTIYSIGKHTNLKGYHCGDCGFNYVNPLFLEKGISLLRLYINGK